MARGAQSEALALVQRLPSHFIDDSPSRSQFWYGPPSHRYLWQSSPGLFDDPRIALASSHWSTSAEVGQAPFRDEAGEPREQAEIQRHRRGIRTRRRGSLREHERARLQRKVFLLPG